MIIGMVELTCATIKSTFGKNWTGSPKAPNANSNTDENDVKRYNNREN